MVEIVDPSQVRLNTTTETSSYGNLAIVPPSSIGYGDLTRSFNERRESELVGMEAAFAARFPNTYGLLGVGLDMIPGARYVLPSQREDFWRLSEVEQRQAILWETIGAELMVGAPAVVKGIKFLGKKLVGPLFKPKGLKPLPIEDALDEISTVKPSFKYKGYNYQEEMGKKLKRFAMSEDERGAVLRALEGDEAGLIDTVVETRYKGLEPSKAFDEATEWIGGRPYPAKRLKADFKGKYREEVVRAQFYGKQFEKTLRKEVFRVKGKKPLPEDFTNVMFKATAEELWGPEIAKGMSFAEIGELEMANITRALLTDTAGLQSVMMTGLKHIMPFSWMPARVAFGTGEAAWQTTSKVFNPAKALFEATNRYHFNSMLKWGKMLEQRGLLKVIEHPSKGFIFKNVKFTQAEMEAAYGALRQADNIISSAKRTKKVAELVLARATAKDLISKLGPNSRALVHAWKLYSDKLYGEYMIHQIPRVLKKAGFNSDGMARVWNWMETEGTRNKIQKLFASSSNRSHDQIFAGIKEVLDDAKKLFGAADSTIYLGKATAKEIEKALVGIRKELTPGRGGFMPYLENYTARMAEGQDKIANSWRYALLQKVQAPFTKTRIRETFTEAPVDFSTMIEARTFAQAKELFLYDGLSEVVKYAERLPPAWAEYVEHWLSRALNRPSITDFKTAAFMTKTVGSIERMFRKEGVWNEHRVMRLAQNVNNVTYMGALGFKPFSVIRNLFQPLLLVPADLGGLKDLGTLARGAARAMRPEMRKELVRIGVITEYAPEITMRPHALPFGKRALWGMSQQRVDQLRDLALWMFRGSDRWNRYVTGASAITKWERALAKVGLEREGLMVFPANKIDDFAKAVKLSGRYEWKQQEIRDLLLRGNHDEAFGTYVRDVVADTQYLYGTLDAPVVTGRSAVARTGFVFQTWWMNYLTTLEKWTRGGGSLGAVGRTDKMITAMVSAAIAEQLMEPLWGRKTAMRAVGLGPVPGEVNEFTIPPAWTPIYHGVAALVNLQDPSVSWRHAKAILSSLPVLVPGGLQAYQLFKGAKKEGFEGFLKAFVKYQPDED